MLDSVKEILTREIDTSDLKAVLTKDIDVKKVLQMEIEINKLKELLATEIKLKEFLLTEINIKDLLPAEVANDHSENNELNDAIALASEKAEKEKIIDTVDTNKKEINRKDQDNPAPKLLLRPYKYGLVEQLRNDHKEIIFMYDLLMMAGKKRDFLLIAKRLAEFSDVIRKHYHVADVDLYTYLKRYIQISFPKREKAFNELSLEMKNISIEIFYSLIQSPNLPVRNVTYHAFMAEFDALGENMKNRIQREEKVLFNMYEESHTAMEIS